MQLYDYFESYLFNKLSTDERQAFESRLSSDSVFKEDFEVHKSMQNAMDILVEDDVMQHIATLDQKPTADVVKKSHPRRRWLSIAASLLFLVAAFYIANNYLAPKEESFMAALDYPIDPATRSSDVEAPIESNYYTLTKPAYDLVKQKKYKQASKLFESYLTQFDGQEKQRAEWDLALVVSTFDMDRSRALLYEISNSKDHVYMKRAKGLLVN